MKYKKHFENENTKFFYVSPYSISQFRIIVIWAQQGREWKREEEIENFHFGEQLQ